MLAVLASYAGFAVLALSQERHWDAVQPSLSAPRRLPRFGAATLRGLGISLQLIALTLAIWAQGPSFGSLLWAVSMSAAAMLVALTLTWRPRLLAPLLAWVTTSRAGA